MTADRFAQQPEADIEDLFGRANYLALVYLVYPTATKLPTKKAASSPLRVAKEVGDHMAVQTAEVPNFDHGAVAQYFFEHPEASLAAMPDPELAFARFEACFKELNLLLGV